MKRTMKQKPQCSGSREGDETLGLEKVEEAAMGDSISPVLTRRHRRQEKVAGSWAAGWREPRWEHSRLSPGWVRGGCGSPRW